MTEGHHCPVMGSRGGCYICCKIYLGPGLLGPVLRFATDIAQ